MITLLFDPKKILLWFFTLTALPLSAEESINQLFAQANQLFCQQELPQAIALYEKILVQKPDYVQTHFNLGFALEYCQRTNEALEHYQKAIEINPRYTKAYGRAIAILETRHRNDELAKLIEYADKILAIEPNNTLMLDKKAQAFIALSDLENAIKTYEQYMLINPTNTTVLNNYAYLLCHANKSDAAIALYQKFLSFENVPTHDTAKLGLAKAYLACGDFAHGWQGLEYRFPNPQEYQQAFGYLKYRPEDLAGKSILIRAEWGFGDMIQFVRYASLLKKLKAKEIIVQSFDALAQIFSSCPFIDRVITQRESIPNVDCQIPCMSLPLFFNTTLETIPAPIPYLYADPTLVNLWHQKLSHDTKFKIGLCWRSKPLDWFENYVQTRRTIPLEVFAPLAQHTDISIYSLQRECDISHENIVDSCKALGIATFDKDFDTIHGRFMDTAAVIQNLDLIITADTSIVHLAGALGKKVWVLLPYAPEWRWLPCLEGYHAATTTPWYPDNMRLFRQHEPGNWHHVIEDVIKALEKEIHQSKILQS